MTIKLKYTSYDFDSIRADLIAKLAQDNVFRDYNFAGSNINTLLEVIASVGDMMGFYANMIANESFLNTADLYENLNKLAELVGYNPNGYTSATVNLKLNSKVGTFDVTGKNNYIITIPKYSKFVSSSVSPNNETIYYTNLNDIVSIINTESMTLPLSSNSITVDCKLIQGSPIDISNNIEFIADGTKYQIYALSDSKILENNLILKVDGIEWTRVESLFKDAISTSKVYTTRFNKDKKVEIKFGDGTFGMIPPLNSVINIRYINTLGKDGIIGPNKLTSIIDNIYITDTSGTSTVLSPSNFDFSQTESSIGGGEPETEEEIRNFAPSKYRTQNRLVSKQDYIDLLQSDFSEYIYKVKAFKYEDLFSNAKKLNALLNTSQINTFSNTLSSMGLTNEQISNLLYSPLQTNQAIYYNNVYVLVVPKLGDFIETSFKTTLKEYIDKRNMITTNTIFLDPYYVPIDCSIIYAKISNTNKSTMEIEMNLKKVLTEYFSRGNRNIEELLIYSDIVKSLSGIDGVRSIVFSFKRGDSIKYKYDTTNIQLTGLEFPKLGNITIKQD